MNAMTLHAAQTLADQYRQEHRPAARAYRDAVNHYLTAVWPSAHPGYSARVFTTGAYVEATHFGAAVAELVGTMSTTESDKR